MLNKLSYLRRYGITVDLTVGLFHVDFFGTEEDSTEADAILTLDGAPTGQLGVVSALVTDEMYDTNVLALIVDVYSDGNLDDAYMWRRTLTELVVARLQNICEVIHAVDNRVLLPISEAECDELFLAARNIYDTDLYEIRLHRLAHYFNRLRAQVRAHRRAGAIISDRMVRHHLKPGGVLYWRAQQHFQQLGCQFELSV